LKFAPSLPLASPPSSATPSSSSPSSSSVLVVRRLALDCVSSQLFAQLSKQQKVGFCFFSFSSCYVLISLFHLPHFSLFVPLPFFSLPTARTLLCITLSVPLGFRSFGCQRSGNRRETALLLFLLFLTSS
jgi:hypothetical protein